MSDIPYGYCQCGCGQRTKVNESDRPNRGYRKGEPRRYLQGHQHNGRNNGAWSGGRFERSDGYVMVYRPEHPRSDGTHVMEHILVAEAALDAALPPCAVVHHVNEHGSDNRPRNLVICEDRAYHNLLHTRMRARAACGDANWLPCTFCGQYDDPKNLYAEASTYHRACKAAYERERRRRKKAEAAQARRAGAEDLSQGSLFCD